jgi:hypothetical protein
MPTTARPVPFVARCVDVLDVRSDRRLRHELLAYVDDEDGPIRTRSGVGFQAITTPRLLDRITRPGRARGRAPGSVFDDVRYEPDMASDGLALLRELASRGRSTPRHPRDADRDRMQALSKMRRVGHSRCGSALHEEMEAARRRARESD